MRSTAMTSEAAYLFSAVHHSRQRLRDLLCHLPNVEVGPRRQHHPLARSDADQCQALRAAPLVVVAASCLKISCLAGVTKGINVLTGVLLCASKRSGDAKSHRLRVLEQVETVNANVVPT